MNSETGNLLLDNLPQNAFRQLTPYLENVSMRIRETICEPGAFQDYAYFPTTSMLSSIIILRNGTTVEAATIGNEGMGGVGLLIKQRASPYRVIQQVDGETLRMSADRFEMLLDEIGPLREMIQRYTFTLLQQTGQNAACNLHHQVEARMCRWLLQTSDRAGRHDFKITQEFLSEMLGVSRQSINVTAKSLQEAGLINYRRGHVIIEDRPRLEDSACECYTVFNDAYERYMNFPIEKPTA
ncbi:MAG: Crp/Fnr family transcriptional regulator [Planctomycetaceae bacterium]|nr:Crp/Fnr family transcriptional regulator [Planctomycetaceae bacterium]